MTLNVPDVIISVMITLSVIVGIIRGFTKESISLVTWLVAIVLSILYVGDLSEYITFTKATFVKNLTAFLIIFFSIILVGAVLNYMVGTFIRKTPFSGPDRILGSAFGLFRGVAVVSILILLGGLTPLPEAPWWQKSYMVSKFQIFAIWLKDRLPDDNAKVFVFSPDLNFSPEKELEIE